MHIHTDKLSKQNMLDISKKQKSKPETGEGFQILPPVFDHETTIPGALPQGHQITSPRPYVSANNSQYENLPDSKV